MKALDSIINKIKVEVSKFNLFSVKNESDMGNANKNKSKSIDKSIDSESKTNALVAESKLAILKNSFVDEVDSEGLELENRYSRNKYVVDVKRYHIGDIINQDQLIKSIEDNSQIDESVIQQFL